MDVGIRDYLAEARMMVAVGDARTQAVVTGVTETGPDDAAAEEYRQQYPTVAEEALEIDPDTVGRAESHFWSPGTVETLAADGPFTAILRDMPRRRRSVPVGLLNIWVTIREATSDNISVRIGDDLYPMEREDALSFARADFQEWFNERTAHMEWPPEDSYDWAESQVRAREESYGVVKERASA